MANPSGHVVWDEEAARTTEECYAALKAELQAIHQRNEELTHGMREQEEVVAVENLRVDRRAQAQMCEFC